MKAVWLDAPTVMSNDFLADVRQVCDFDVLAGLPEPDEVVRRLKGVELAVVEWTSFDDELLSRLDTLRYLCLVTTAGDTVDVASAVRHGIVVTNCPTYSAPAVAEYVIGALIAADRSILASNVVAKRGRSHVYHPFAGRGLEGSVLGLVGMGNIGRELAGRAKALGMTVVGCNRSGNPVPGIRVLPLPEVLGVADFLSVQVPYGRATHHLLSAGDFDLLPPHAVVVNVSRARVLDEEALADRLMDGRLRAAVVDDVANPGASRLLTLPNVLVTTGIAWFTEPSVGRNFRELADTIRSCVGGAPVNVLAAL